MLRLNHIPIWEDVLDLHVLQNLHLECVDFVAANVTVYGTVNGTSSVNFYANVNDFIYKMSKSPNMSVMDWCILNSLFIFLSEILIRWLWCQFHWWYQYHWWCLCHYYIVCQCHTSSQGCCMIKLQCYDMSLWLDFKFVSDDVADQFWGVTINCGFQIKKIKNRKWDSSEICNLLVWNYAYMYLKC